MGWVRALLLLGVLGVLLAPAAAWAQGSGHLPAAAPGAQAPTPTDTTAAGAGEPGRAVTVGSADVTSGTVAVLLSAVAAVAAGFGLIRVARSHRRGGPRRPRPRSG